MCILSVVELNPGSLQSGPVKVSLSFPPALRPPESWASGLEVLWPGSYLPRSARALPTVSPLPRTMQAWIVVRCSPALPPHWPDLPISLACIFDTDTWKRPSLGKLTSSSYEATQG